MDGPLAAKQLGTISPGKVIKMFAHTYRARSVPAAAEAKKITWQN